MILTLATVGVLLSASLTAAGMHFLVGWPWAAALLFGVLIAATDPVSVIAIFREAGIHGRLRVLVEAESLLNDGTAAVAFGVVLAAVQGGAVTGGGIALSFVVTVLGGVVCGLLVAGAVLLVVGHTDDHLLEVAFTAVAAYGSFLLAEQFHLSGVLASLSAGILIGNTGSLGALTDKGRDAVLTVWEFVAFIVNSLIFLLMGLRLTQEHIAAFWLPSLVAVAVVVLGRPSRSEVGPSSVLVGPSRSIRAARSSCAPLSACHGTISTSLSGEAYAGRWPSRSYWGCRRNCRSARPLPLRRLPSSPFPSSCRA